MAYVNLDRWRYMGSQRHPGCLSRPSHILSLEHIKANNIKLFIEDLPIIKFDDDFHDVYLQAFPANHIASLKMTSPLSPLTSRLECVKRLLLEAHHIETFHYSDRGQGQQFLFEANERLPAFEDLMLRSYDWNHSIEDVRGHWDFSRLRHLTLIDVPLFQFLSSVPYTELHHLRTLHCEDFSTHLLDRRLEATDGLYELVNQIQSLCNLKVTCHTNLFPVHGLLRHADSLRVLSFRDYVGFEDEGRPCPTMWDKHLALLSRKLVGLQALELDMDVALCESSLFLRALCNFARLDTLVLHTQTVLRPLEDGEYPINEDWDYDAALQTFSTLVHDKQGTPWRNIVITVGGWKPAMARRMSEVWREWHKIGVYAERCFVLERNTETGEITIQEVGVAGSDSTLYSNVMDSMMKLR